MNMAAMFLIFFGESDWVYIEKVSEKQVGKVDVEKP